MLRLRPDQFASFAPRVATLHLQAAFPARAAVLGPAALQSLAERGLARAPGYGLGEERDAMRFLIFLMIAGAEADHAPWAAPVLRNPRLTPRQRLDICLARARRQGLTAGAAA
jgi:hypothetical protein